MNYANVSKSSRRTHNQALFLLGMLAIGVLFGAFGSKYRRVREAKIPKAIVGSPGTKRTEPTGFANLHDSVESTSKIVTPNVQEESKKNGLRTVYVVPGNENRCFFRYNYVCKFWFFIRCYVFSAFPKAKMLSFGPAGVDDLKRLAKSGDIAVVLWRSKKHREVPNNLNEILDWQSTFGLVDNVPRIRVGVFHIANEVNRTFWPWYTKPDFIVRNYWIPDMPQHVTYVPLGPQLPNNCQPWSTEHDRWMDPPRQPSCKCKSLSLPPISNRKYLWHFSGSLRKQRKRLVRMLESSPSLRNKGYLQIAKKFGGDGEFGTKANNPKTEYLQSILNSKFVFAPCGNAMETHRIYEAVALGAIPVIENCDDAVSHFFPFRELVVDTPLENMLQFVQQYADDNEEIDKLQRRLLTWWGQHMNEFAANVSRVMTTHVPASLRTAI